MTRRRTYILTNEQREEAVRLYNEEDLPITKIAEMFGCSKQNISLLLKAKKRQQNEDIMGEQQ